MAASVVHMPGYGDSTLRLLLIISVVSVPAAIILWGIAELGLGSVYSVNQMSVEGSIIIVAGFLIYVLELVAYTLLKRNGYCD